MEYVKFIRRLEVSEVPMLNGREVAYHICDRAVSRVGEDAFLSLDEPVESRIAPVHTFFRQESGQTRKLYIAYSQEVQELLGVPYDALLNDLDSARSLLSAERAKVSRVKHARFWDRLKYAFSGKAALLGV